MLTILWNAVSTTNISKLFVGFSCYLQQQARDLMKEGTLPFVFLPKTPPSNLLPGVGVNGVIFGVLALSF